MGLPYHDHGYWPHVCGSDAGFDRIARWAGSYSKSPKTNTKKASESSERSGKICLEPIWISTKCLFSWFRSGVGEITTPA